MACESRAWTFEECDRIAFLRWLEMLEIITTPETKMSVPETSAANARRFPHDTNTQEIGNDTEVVSRGA